MSSFTQVPEQTGPVFVFRFQYPKFLYARGPTVRSQAGYRLVKSIKPGKVPFKSVWSVFMRSYCSRSRSVRFAFTQSQMKSQTRDRSSREWMINLWIHKGPFFHICTSLESKNRNSKARMHVTTGRECVCWNARYIKHTHTHTSQWATDEHWAAPPSVSDDRHQVCSADHSFTSVLLSSTRGDEAAGCCRCKANTLTSASIHHFVENPPEGVEAKGSIDKIWLK